jgi:hypothetical protein
MLWALVSCESPLEPEVVAADQEQQQTAGQSALSPPGSDSGFRDLFDGVSITGWHGYGGSDTAGRWHVQDGVLAIDSSVAGQADLVTDEEFENFELRLEWKISAGGNSGIMFNVAEIPEYSAPWHSGPEVQILDNGGHADSSLKHRAGDLYDLLASNIDNSRPAGDWNESRLQVDNGLVRHWLNGVLVFEVQMWDEAWDELVAGSKFGSMPGFGRYRSGRIVLQDHGDVVAFRNIRIRK